MGLAEPVQRIAEADYLQMERQADFKSEYFDGEIFAMAGGSPQHSLITANLIRELGNQLKGRGCVVFEGNLRVKVETTGLHTYPDLTVVCGPRRFADEAQDTLVNPGLIVEVLSDSTEAYDRGKKFENYRQIPSLLEYLLVSQRAPRVEQYIRQAEGDWLLRETSQLKGILRLPTLQVELALADIYAQVDFSPATLRPSLPRGGKENP